MPKGGNFSVSVCDDIRVNNDSINNACHKLLQVNTNGVFCEKNLYVDGSIHCRDDISIVEDDRMKLNSNQKVILQEDYDEVWNIINGINIQKSKTEEKDDLYSFSGQEICDHYPAGTRKITSYIPNINQEGILTHLKGSYYIIQLKDEVELEPEQELKLITATRNIFCKVVTSEDNLIKVDIPLPLVSETKVLVYGKKTKDLCCVYKDRLVPLLFASIKNMNDRIKKLEDSLQIKN